MNRKRKCLFLSLVLTILMSFNVFAMNNKYSSEDYPKLASPSTEKRSGDHTKDLYWIWLSDDLCIRTTTREQSKRVIFQTTWDIGAASRWSENDAAKIRETYSGKWSQDANGIWSFVFDDYTIPVGPTKIDGVIYAFNGYGELMDGYNYWGDLKTGPDGLVVTDNPEFTAWLATQYLPECTSHE